MIRDKKGIRQGKSLLTIVSLALRSGIVAKAEIFHRLSFGIVGDCVGPGGYSSGRGLAISDEHAVQEHIVRHVIGLVSFEGRHCLRRAASWGCRQNLCSFAISHRHVPTLASCGKR